MKNSAEIFIVEDDEGIREVYSGALEDEYKIVMFENGADFFREFPKNQPDLIILDIMLPDMDGYTILQKIRTVNERIPVIIVSAKNDELSFVKGLNKGVDDYMAKPFSILELLARVKTCLRRSNLYISSAGNFSIDRNTYKASYCGKDLCLTLKEYRMFDILLGNAGITIDRAQLFREVWNDDFMGETRALDMHIATLREKIKEAGGGEPIITVRGVGYRFETK